MENVPVNVVQGMLTSGMTCAEISEELRRLHPGVSRGFSERSVRRFVSKNDLRKAAREIVEQAVRESVQEVGQSVLLTRFASTFQILSGKAALYISYEHRRHFYAH